MQQYIQVHRAKQCLKAINFDLKECRCKNTSDESTWSEICHLMILPDPPTTLSIRSLAKVGPWRFLATMSVNVVTIDNPFLCHEIERSRHAFQMYTWLPQCIILFKGQELHRSPFVLCFATAGVIISLRWCDFPGIGAKSGTSAKFWILGKSRARLSHSFRNRNSNDFPF